jgi:hypothetical protein
MPCQGIQRYYYVRRLVLSPYLGHRGHMRAALLMLFGATSWAGDAFGVWRLNQARSTLAENQKSVTLRIEPHTGGEVFTLDTVGADGRASTFSTILYFDGKARAFRDSSCSGTQSSHLVDSRTVEILRECASGVQIRLVRRAVQPGVLILEITDQDRAGHRSERRLVMEKQ